MLPPRSSVLLVGAVLALAATTGSAQTVINSVPYTISTSGKYVLGNNAITATASQTAITISAPNVILDLNGFFVSGPGNNTASSTAVISVGDVSNVTIRNGTVANNGFGISISPFLGQNSINHLIEEVNLTRCYKAGIYIGVASPGTLLRDNTISQIGGFTGGSFPAYGIFTFSGVRIEDNSITGVTAAGTGSAYGIQAADGDFVIGNTISNSTFGVFGGKYQNNLTSGCTTPFSGGVNATGNN